MRPSPRQLPTSAASFATPVESHRPAVLDLDTVTLDDLRTIDRRWNRLRQSMFMLMPVSLPAMMKMGLVGDLLMLLTGLMMAVAALKPSVLLRVVARAHGCSPALTRWLIEASHTELGGFPIGSNDQKRLAYKDVQFRHILTHRESVVTQALETRAASGVECGSDP